MDSDTRSARDPRGGNDTRAERKASKNLGSPRATRGEACDNDVGSARFRSRGRAPLLLPMDPPLPAYTSRESLLPFFSPFSPFARSLGAPVTAFVTYQRHFGRRPAAACARLKSPRRYRARGSRCVSLGRCRAPLSRGMGANVQRSLVRRCALPSPGRRRRRREARRANAGASSLWVLKRPSARRGPGIVSVDRNVRSKCRCSCVLQFTS